MTTVDLQKMKLFQIANWQQYIFQTVTALQSSLRIGERRIDFESPWQAYRDDPDFELLGRLRINPYRDPIGLIDIFAGVSLDFRSWKDGWSVDFFCGSIWMKSWMMLDDVGCGSLKNMTFSMGRLMDWMVFSCFFFQVSRTGEDRVRDLGLNQN